jgi:hypothetical protein
LNLLARIIWYRGKAKINRALHHGSIPNIPPVQSSGSLPYEIVEMIISHLIYDLQTLKACSLTCYSWYLVAVPHIHHTFVLRAVDRGSLKPLLARHALGLIPLVKEIWIPWSHTSPDWLLPQFFGRRDFRHFFAFTNIQSLTIQHLDIHEFIPGLNRYFGHLSPTLRSLTLGAPRSTPQELSHFISLFPNLDDIEIQSFVRLGIAIPDKVLVPFSTPKLRGQLTLTSSPAVETWEHLAASCGLRFRSIHLNPVSNCAPVLLAACAETLETL